MIEYMSEVEGTATRDITVTISGWDALMIDRIAQHQDLPVGNIASAALNTGLHRYADTLGIPRPRIRRPHRRYEGGDEND